jgi:hypothetical protein
VRRRSGSLGWPVVNSLRSNALGLSSRRTEGGSNVGRGDEHPYLHRLSEREDRSRTLTTEHFHLAAEAIRREQRRRWLRRLIGWTVAGVAIALGWVVSIALR